MVVIPRKHLQTAIDMLRHNQRELDEAFEEARLENGHVFTCKKGCHDCCYLFVDCMYTEALGIADLLLKQKRVAMAPQLAAAAVEMLPYGTCDNMWFRKQRPCVFLEKGLCSIYPARPANCRYHAVITPPLDCSISRPGTKVARIDKMQYIQAFVKFQVGFQAHHDTGGNRLLSAPLPMAVLWAMHDLSKGGDRVAIKDAIKQHKVPTIDEWTGTMGELFNLRTVKEAI